MICHQDKQERQKEKDSAQDGPDFFADGLENNCCEPWVSGDLTEYMLSELSNVIELKLDEEA